MAHRLTKKIQKNLSAGALVPIAPLLLRPDGSLDETAQRALTRYYRDAGVGGLAVGCSTAPLGDLFKPLLRVSAAALEEVKKVQRSPLLRIAAVSGPTEAAVKQAQAALEAGYHMALLEVGEVSADPVQRLERFKAVAEVLPLFGARASRQEAVVSHEEWLALCETGKLAAIQLGGPTRRATLDAARAVRDSSMDRQIPLYTGNEDSALLDLMSRFAFTSHRDEPRLEIVGGLLQSWGFWTRRTLDHFNEAKRLMDKRLPVSRQLAELALQAADVSTAVLNLGGRGAAGGVLEVLRRQGFIEQARTLDPEEALTARQSAEIERIYRDYPHLYDDPFVDLHSEEWFS